MGKKALLSPTLCAIKSKERRLKLLSGISLAHQKNKMADELSN
jgi:hypothetical protein